MSNIGNRMFPAWRQWAIEEGLGGLDIIESRQAQFESDKQKPPADAVNEFQPHEADNMFHSNYYTERRSSRVYHRGTIVCWDSTPRHATDGLAPINPLCHPTKWQYHVVQMLKRVKLDPNPPGVENFFFVNALNQWGEGNVLEPTVQFGDAYGKAMLNALTISDRVHPWYGDLINRGLERDLKMNLTGQSKPDVCVIVRATSNHSDLAIFSLGTMLASLQAQNNKNWKALVIQANNASFPDLEQIVSAPLDSRIRLAWVPEDQLNATEDGDYAALATDWALLELDTLFPSCASAKFLLLSSGKDTF